MKALLILTSLLIIMNFYSCGDNSPEPTKELECGLEYIIRTDVTGQILEYSALSDTNDWKTFANEAAKGMENEFKLEYPYPNPIFGYLVCEMKTLQFSKVKLFLNDSLLIESYIYQGTNAFSFELKNYPSGCYKLKAECYLGQTENSPISNKILTSSGRVMVVGRN